MELEEMGVVVHLHLNTLENYKDFDMSLGKLGNIPVATFANRFYDYKELAFKRAIDIVGSLVGLCIMAVAMILLSRQSSWNPRDRYFLSRNVSERTDGILCIQVPLHVYGRRRT